MNQLGLFDLTSSSSPGKQPQPSLSSSPPDDKDLEIARLREELNQTRNRLSSWDEGMQQARAACDAWKKETVISSKKVEMALKEKDSAMAKVVQLQKEVESLQGGPYLHAVKRVAELKTLPVGVIKAIDWQLRKDLQEVEKVRNTFS